MSLEPRTIHFSDYPDFKPNLTPYQIFALGSFGGTYWRPIKSKLTGKMLKNKHKKYKWSSKIDDNLMTREWDDYDKNLNTYGVKVGTTYEYWISKGWIDENAEYGWVQWYCDFYDGERGYDDERQIKRWIRTAGSQSRFRKNLINQIKRKGGIEEWDNSNISPRIRQTLQHWAYKLTYEDYMSN